MKFEENFGNLIAKYNYFVFDVWGVVHDGVAAFPNVLETFEKLKKLGKKVCFLSNAPRKAEIVAKVLQSYGLTSEFYDFIITSGEATFLDLKKNQDENFGSFGRKYYYVGPKKDIGLLDELQYERVLKAQNADFVLATGFEDVGSTLDEKLPQIIEAKKHDLPMICVNPDMLVVRKDGAEFLCAGVLAKEYEKMQGEVHYYGKPHIHVYDFVHEFFGFPDKKEMLAIGDGLETDIKGAANFGIDSVLVTSGILCNKLGVKFGQKADEKKLQEICALENVFPQYIITNL